MWLGGFQIIDPQFKASQRELAEWLVEARIRAGQSPEQAEAQFRKYGVSPSKIASRWMETGDFAHRDWDKMRLFNITPTEPGATIRERTLYYGERASRAFDRLYADPAIAAPDDLIHVTCTGYLSPSAAQLHVASRGWAQRTRVTHAYQMGCYASIPAARIAAGFLASPQAPSRRVDLVHTELCSLHFNPLSASPEQTIVQTLFADGIIRYQAGGERIDGLGAGLDVVAIHEHLVPGTDAAMTWRSSTHCMDMTLAREVPQMIGAALPAFVADLFQRAGLDLGAERERAVFAVHPGGPRVVEAAQDLLRLRPDQVSASLAVLRERGNMSSATLPHIWSRICADDSVAPGTWVASLAFGPGLTIAGMLARKA